MNKNRVVVEIAGHEYKILTDGDPAAVREFSRYADKEMRRIRERTGTVDSLDVAVLACVNLAREVLILQNQAKNAEGGARLRSLTDRVEAILSFPADPTTSSANAVQIDSKSNVVASDTQLAKTLELPRVDARREREGANPANADSRDASLPEARAAAGGRDRAS